MHEGAPVSVTNVMPATINTPFFTSARTKMGVKPQGMPPFYQPQVVADVILYAAEHPVRDLIAGGAGKMMITAQKFAPSLMVKVLSTERGGFASQKTNEPKAVEAANNFYAPLEHEDRAEGDFSSKAKSFSLYDLLEMRGALGTLLAGGALGAAALFLTRKSGGNSSDVNSAIGQREEREGGQTVRPDSVLVAGQAHT
jgi:hypothetical protein